MAVSVPSSSDNASKPESGTPVQAAAAGREQHVHVKKLNVWQLTAICFFAVAGGPFGFEEAIGSAGAKWSYVGLVVIPLIWSIPIALMTVELSTLIPDIGGQITWVERGLGPVAGFANSMLCLLTTFSDNALYPVIFLDYMRSIVGSHVLNAGLSWTIRVVIVALCAALNIRGVDVLGDATVSFGIIVMLPFAVMAGFGLFAKSAGPITAPRVISWGSFLSTTMWCTSGFDSAGTCASDVDNIASTFPKAVALSVVLVILTYVVPMPGALKALPDASEWQDGSWSTAANILAGNWLGTWIAIAAMVSNLGILSTMLCTTSRQLVGIAGNGHLPFSKFVSREHPSWETPYIMITLNACISLGFTALDFGGLAQVTTVFYSTSTILRFLALWRLRCTEATTERPFRIPGGHFGMALICIPPIGLSLFASSQCDMPELIIAISFMFCVVCATGGYWLFSLLLDTPPQSGAQGAYVTLEETDAAKPPAATCIEITAGGARAVADSGEGRGGAPTTVVVRAAEGADDEALLGASGLRSDAVGEYYPAAPASPPAVEAESLQVAPKPRALGRRLQHDADDPETIASLLHAQGKGGGCEDGEAPSPSGSGAPGGAVGGNEHL